MQKTQLKNGGPVHSTAPDIAAVVRSRISDVYCGLHNQDLIRTKFHNRITVLMNNNTHCGIPLLGICIYYECCENIPFIFHFHTLI